MGQLVWIRCYLNRFVTDNDKRCWGYIISYTNEWDETQGQSPFGARGRGRGRDQG